MVSGDSLDAIGCVVDFAVLKEALGHVAAGLDHRLLNELPPFGEVNPTAENLAAHFFKEMRSNLGRYTSVRLEAVTVWESATAAVTYREE